MDPAIASPATAPSLDPVAAAWETLDEELLRLIVSKRRTARFRALLANVCKTWNAAILQNTFADLEPFLHNLDQRKLVGVLRLAWTQPASLRTALSAAVGDVWTHARPPAGGGKRAWLADQVLKNDWVEKKQRGVPYAASWAPHRLRFTRGKVSISHALGNWHCPQIDNLAWRRGQGHLSVNGDKVQELNVCEYGCGSESIHLTLNENLAGELQLVLTTISSCLCDEDAIYGTPPEELEEVSTYALMDEDDDGDYDEDENEDESESEDEDECEDQDQDQDQDPVTKNWTLEDARHLGGRDERVQVELVGLQSRPDLNGCAGYLEGWLEDKGRYSVNVMQVMPTGYPIPTGHASEWVNVLPTNVILPASTRVRLTGLVESPQFNELIVEIVRADLEGGRYEVRLSQVNLPEAWPQDQRDTAFVKFKNAFLVRPGSVE